MKLLLLISLLSACATKRVPNPPVVKPSPVVDMVNVTKFTNFTGEELEKAKAYIPVMNKTLASKCFSDFMIARKMIKTNDLTNEQVVEKLRTSTVDIELIMYYRYFSKVHGYTYPDVSWIKLNRKYHSGASLCSEASNLAHEGSHKLGFGHAFKATTNRPYSVPYSINAAFKECCI